jgi:Na+-translocating ferredoxin:NAD+ oxidoreductase subunit B
MAVIVILAIGAMVLLGAAFALVLGWSNVKFAIPSNPQVEAVTSVLPGANCGGCGMTGCVEYAKAVVEGRIAANKCPVGGSAVAQAIADVLGIAVDESAPYRPVIHCGADFGNRLLLADYRGEATCFAANVIGDVQGCAYGCLGFGDCDKACKYDAIHTVNGLAKIDYAKCVGCGACEKACPRHIVSMVPFKAERMLVVSCSNKDPGRQVRRVCKVGCLGCRLCQKLMDVFEVKNNVSTVNYEKYHPGMDFSQVIAKCPGGVMLYVGKPSEKDLAAVAGEETPAIVTDKFKTTADEAVWRV